LVGAIAGRMKKLVEGKATY